MDNTSENTRPTVVSQLRVISKNLFGILAAGTILWHASYLNAGQPAVTIKADPVIGQTVFSTPNDAANAFVRMVSNDDKDGLSKLFGADFREVLSLDEVKGEDVDNFLAAWERHNTLLPQDDQKVLLAVGDNQWTLPIPIVAGPSGWYYDTQTGREQMRIRRIGRNELACIQAVLAYYDAQMEYAEQDRNSNGVLEYAQKFISTPNSHNGLYWKAAPDEAQSPLGSLFSGTTLEDAYHGYYYRILTSQGEHAKHGAYSYLRRERMTSGFALVAWPAEYGESGVLSFIVSHRGIVYEQDLGPGSADAAAAMLGFDPGPGWIPVQQAQDSQASAEANSE